MKKTKIIANIGRFVEEKGEIYYVDSQGKVWSHKMMSDLVNGMRSLNYSLKVVEHYKKQLE